MFTTLRAKMSPAILPSLIAMILGLLGTVGQRILPGTNASSVLAQQADAVRRVNVPYWDWAAGDPYPSHSVFWFGQVGPSTNYVDVRTIYYDEHLEVHAHIVDRNLYQSDPVAAVDLTEWDAISLYLHLGGNAGDAPTSGAYRFDVQLGQWDEPDYGQRAFTGDGASWVAAPVPFTAETSWRGTDGPNSGRDSKGWTVSVIMPFSSFGLAGPPPPGTQWGFAVALHDRDSLDAAATITTWPEYINLVAPGSWGQLHFGRVDDWVHDAVTTGETTIRQGVDGVTVPDAHVGGHGNCGAGLDHWSEWGVANYAGETQINIQNQWDISDYPCFSKYYVTFPLDTIPAGKTIFAAEVTLFLFGNAGYQPSDAPVSAIQAFTVAEAWDEATITWNNAPLASENVALTWVEPVDGFDPGVPYHWDVGNAVAEAYAAGEPLRLAFYSADGEYHSGKYFWSSDAEASVRPMLRVTWQEDIGNVPLTNRAFVPLVSAP